MMERSEHMRGLLRLVGSNDVERVKRWIQNPRGREKLLEWLAHKGDSRRSTQLSRQEGSATGEACSLRCDGWVRLQHATSSHPTAVWTTPSATSHTS